MEVYIVIHGADYESEDIVGVYDSMEKAVAAAEEELGNSEVLIDDSEDYKEWRRPSSIGGWGCDFTKINVWEVQ